MKKEVLIRLSIDTEQTGSFMRSSADETEFTVAVCTDLGCDPLVAAAHELGHVLGAVFNLPLRQQDPRVPKNQARYTGGVTLDTFRSEQEAWDVAEWILQQRRYSLGTYLKHLKGTE